MVVGAGGLRADGGSGTTAGIFDTVTGTCSPGLTRPRAITDGTAVPVNGTVYAIGRYLFDGPPRMAASCLDADPAGASAAISAGSGGAA